MELTDSPYKKKRILCECRRRKGKLFYSPEEGYEYKGGCIKDAICSMLVRLKHKHLKKKNKKLQQGEEVKIYETSY